MERIWLFRDDVIRSGRYAKWAVAFASEFGVDVEVVGAVEVDVVVLRRGQVCRGLVGDREAFGAQGVKGIREIGRCPEHRGVGDEGQAKGLVDLVVEMTSSDVSLVGESSQK